MKKIIKLQILIMFFLTGFQSNSQENFTTYNNRTINETYDIVLTKDKVGFTLFIMAYSNDDLHKTGGIVITQKTYNSFLKSLNNAKEKYEEWVVTAKENNVKELNKEMPIKCKVGGFFDYGGDWHFQKLLKPTFDFIIIESDDGTPHYWMLVRTGELQSAKNRFMNVDGFVLAFTSSNDIEEFINKISLQKIDEFIQKPKAEALFN